eukprot:8416696-Alexandrium_andersonii.AAC.1
MVSGSGGLHPVLAATCAGHPVLNFLPRAAPDHRRGAAQNAPRNGDDKQTKIASRKDDNGRNQ